MSTLVFQSFFIFLHHFVLTKLVANSIRVTSSEVNKQMVLEGKGV